MQPVEFLATNDTEVAGYIVLSSYNNSRIKLHPIEASDVTEKGYICEKDLDWICPDKYILFQEDCYHIENISRAFTSALLDCNSKLGSLTEPWSQLHILFLQSYLKDVGVSLIWTGYRKQVFKDVEGTATVYTTSSFEKSDFAGNLQTSGNFLGTAFF